MDRTHQTGKSRIQKDRNAIYDNYYYLLLQLKNMTPILKVIGGGLTTFLGQFSVFQYMIKLSKTEQQLFTEFKKLAPLSKYRASTDAKMPVFYS